MTDPLVNLDGLHKHFPLPSSFLSRHKPGLICERRYQAPGRR